MNHNYGASYENVRLRPLKKEDIEKLRIWRNDASKTQYLRPIGEITPEMQERWYEDYFVNPDEIIFAIEENERLNRIVGSIALYNFHGDTAEVGKIQIGDSEANGCGIGRKSLVMAMWIGFQKLNLKKIVGSVHRKNKAAHINDIRVGFQIVGEHESPVGGIEDEIEIDEGRLLQINPYIPQIILD